MKYQVGVAGDPSEDDPKFDDESAAINYAKSMAADDSRRAIAVWKSNAHMLLFYLNHQFRSV